MQIHILWRHIYSHLLFHTFGGFSNPFFSSYIPYTVHLPRGTAHGFLPLKKRVLGNKSTKLLFWNLSERRWGRLNEWMFHEFCYQCRQELVPFSLSPFYPEGRGWLSCRQTSYMPWSMIKIRRVCWKSNQIHKCGAKRIYGTVPVWAIIIPQQWAISPAHNPSNIFLTWWPFKCSL